MRELAAEGLGELVEVTGEEALKPFVVQASPPHAAPLYFDTLDALPTI